VVSITFVNCTGLMRLESTRKGNENKHFTY